MINANYVDGLELRIKELNKKLSDEADAALHLIAENNSLKAERDALAATVEALRDTCSYWINHARPSGDCTKSEYNTWLALGYHSRAMTKSAQQHFAEIRAQAVISAVNFGRNQTKYFLRSSEDILQQIEQYADSIRR